MSYRHSFQYPDYYPEFACKCGDCRATCCHGWRIALSQDEYFRVTGADCSPELRRRLDVAFRPADPAPTPERYVLISYNWLGLCPLQREDGLCMLHRECGEEAIPEICRRYPRCARVLPIHECCTSTACERTLELLFSNDAPVKIVSGECEMYDEDFDTHPSASLDAHEYERVRDIAFSVMSDRTKNIGERLSFLADKLGVPADTVSISADDAARLYAKLVNTSESLSDVADTVNEYYKEGSEVSRFSLDSVPETAVYIEKMLVNHIFYKAFPRSFENSSYSQEMKSLASVVALHKYVSEAYLAAFGWSLENFIDITARLFRMIEHSRFDEVAARFLS